MAPQTVIHSLNLYVCVYIYCTNVRTNTHRNRYVFAGMNVWVKPTNLTNITCSWAYHRRSRKTNQPMLSIATTLEIVLPCLEYSYYQHSVLFKIHVTEHIMHVMSFYFLVQLMSIPFFLSFNSCYAFLLECSSVIEGLFLGRQIWNSFSPTTPL